MSRPNKYADRIEQLDCQARLLVLDVGMIMMVDIVMTVASSSTSTSS
jgi:hypothetical protein